MKMIVAVALAFVAVAVAAPADVPQILRSVFEQNPDGSYVSSFETENGLNRQETGEVKEVLNEENKPQAVVVVRGSYSYPGEDGKPITITYKADENGFHAEGDSIPKPVSRR